MTSLERLKAKESALVSRIKTLRSEVADMEMLSEIPGGLGLVGWANHLREFGAELKKNQHKLAGVRRSIQRELLSGYRDIQADMAKTVDCDCSLSGADPPWMWSWSSVTQFSDMQPIPFLLDSPLYKRRPRRV